MEYSPKSIEDTLNDIKLMERGIKPESEPWFDFKIGEIRPCHKCGKPTTPITYSDNLDWWKQVQVSCVDCHKIPDIGEKFVKREKEIRDIKLKCRDIVEKVKPNDSYLDWTKVRYVASNTYFYDLKPSEWEFWLEEAYALYIMINKQ